MKRLRFSYLAVILIVIVGCNGRYYNRVTTFNDEFKGRFKKVTRVSVRSEERRTEINAANVIFEKDMTDLQYSGISRAYFVISRASSSFPISKTGYMKGGGNKFELHIEDSISEFKSESETTYTSTATSDSTGVSVSQTADTDTEIWFDEKFMIELTPGMVSSILEADELVFRFYFGPIPGTFIFRGRSLEAVKGVFR